MTIDEMSPQTGRILKEDGTTVNIGDLIKAEDAAHGSGDTGIMLLAVRSATAAALAGTAGDYIPLIVSNSGRLYTTSELTEQPARSATVDNIGTADIGGTVMIGTTAYTVKRALGNVAASSTDESIVAAVASKKIRVISLVMIDGGTATEATFGSKVDAEATVAVSCLFANGANSGAVLGRNVDGWFETAEGAALVLTTGAGSATGVMVNYIEV
jgi:hypothetical protein